MNPATTGSKKSETPGRRLALPEAKGKQIMKTSTQTHVLVLAVLTCSVMTLAPGSALAQPVCGPPPPPPPATKWRIRNATVQANSGQWVLREMHFCADADCTQPLTGGTAIDSGDSTSWSLPEYAFDGDTTTFWKTFDTDVAGQSWLGMDFGANTGVHGIYIKTDNVVYSVDTIYVEYYDSNLGQWITADILYDVPAASELTYSVKIRQSFPISWRIRNATVQANSGQWVIREMDFCTDPDCNTPLTGGTAFDSGDSTSWSLPEYAFDGDTTTFWKTFDTDVAGQSYIGQDFTSITEAHGLYIKTDNVVYSVDSIYVEYYDALSAQWVTLDTLDDVPAASELTYSLSCP
jgi:hypothetical protein